MGKIGFNVDVNDADIADQIERRIEDGIENSISPRKPNSLGRKIKKAMREHIRRHGRVWTTELLNSFEIEADTSGTSNLLIVRNDADHAEPIDLGATYGDEGPPLHKLIPWVESKLKGYRVRGGALVKYKSDDGGKTILTDGSGKRRGSSRDLPPDLEVEEVNTLASLGIEGGVNQNSAYHVTFENGESAYFQAYKDPDDPFGSDPGTVRNEVVFTRLASEEDWRIGPENRAGTIVDPDNDEITRGNFQRWIDGAEPVEHQIDDPFTPEDHEVTWTPPEFLEEHEEQLAQMTVLDILLGNDDRHGKNLVVDPDGNIHAIDNGGHFLPTEEYLEGMINYGSVTTGLEAFQYFDEFPELEDAFDSFFETQIIFLTEFLEERREDILQHTRLIHGRESPVYRRMERLLDHSTAEIVSQVEAYQQQMLDTRTQSLDAIDNALEEADIDDFDGDLDDLNDL